LGVGDAGVPGRGQDERVRQRLPEQGGRTVDVTDLAEDARPELDTGERLRVAPPSM
jgi:hypothetical protein